jgi:hypothetical protein
MNIAEIQKIVASEILRVQALRKGVAVEYVGLKKAFLLFLIDCYLSVCRWYLKG